jgi:hypothetical protein
MIRRLLTWSLVLFFAAQALVISILYGSVEHGGQFRGE